MIIANNIKRFCHGHEGSTITKRFKAAQAVVFTGSAVLICLFLSAAVTGCSGIKSDYQEKKMFRLAARPEKAQAHAHEKGKTLLVKRFSISPEFEAVSFMYRAGKNRFASDYYHNYVVPPARMLTDIIGEALYASDLFTPISPNTVNEIQYQLWGKILEVYGDARDKNHLKSVITIRFVLDQNKGDGFTPLLHKTYSARIPMDAPDPKLFIIGLNKGLTRILDQFFTDIETSGGRQDE